MSKMTRQRKWLLGVLGVGVAAVVLDRAMLGGPEAANASDGQAVESDAAIEPVVSTSPTPDLGAPARTGPGPLDLSDFAERLEGLTAVLESDSTRPDVFTPPAEWEETLVDLEPAGPVTDGPLGNAFKVQHTLNGTMNRNGIDYAIVDGNPVQVGEAVDDFILRLFANRQALWQSTVTGEYVVLREVP